MCSGSKKVAAEGNLYTFRRPDYSAEEWRFLYLTTITDLYIDSIRLVPLNLLGVQCDVVVVASLEKFLSILKEFSFCVSHEKRVFSCSTSISTGVNCKTIT